MTRIDLPAEKKVGHLTLLRQSRTLSTKEFNALSFDERLAMVRFGQGRRKYDLLLEAADAEPMVRRLPAQEIYLLIKEMGAEDVPLLFATVSPEQFTTFIDLDCWRQDRLDPEVALRWMLYLLEAGEEKVLSTLQGLDFELLVLVFKKLIVITRGPEDIDDEEELTAALQRDGGYEIECRDSENAKAVLAILDILFRLDNTFYLQLMSSVRWEQESLLEEEVYRVRTGRLQDHGFSDPFEALAVYAWIDPEGFDPAGHGKLPMAPEQFEVEAPGFVLAAARPHDLLAEVLAGGVGTDTCWELTFLLNKTMAADRVDVGDPQQVQASMTEVYQYLNLALEHLAGDDTARAAELVEGVYQQTLFRLGFSLTLRLQRRARAILDSAVAPYLDGPFRALTDALCRSKPRLFEGVESESRGGERPFANLHDVRLAEKWLDRLEVQQRLFVERFPFELPAVDELDFAGCVPDDTGDLVLSDFFLTALANRILGRSFIPRPLPEEELPALHARICSEGRLDEELRRETGHWLDSLEPGAGAFGDYCFGLWEEEFCRLEAGRIDPRFISGLIVRLK